MTSCGSRQPETEYNYQIYYLNKQETRIFPVDYGTNQAKPEPVVEELLARMSTVPEKLEYIPPLAAGFSLLDYNISDKQIVLSVDEKYREQPITTEVLVRAALVKTLTQVEGIDYVSMLIRSEPLADANGNLIGIMSADMFIDNTGNAINAYERTRLKLYFTDEDGTMLVPVQRSVVYNSNISLEKLVVEELIKGPDQDEAVFATINPETRIISVTVKDGVCYVNLDKTFLIHLNSVSANATVYSITNSLAELPNINKVQIAINGDTNVTYKDVIHLSTIFERNLDIIGSN